MHDLVEDIIGAILALTGRDPPDRVVTAYAKALLAVEGATPEDIEAAASEAVAEHDPGFGIYWPPAAVISGKVRAAVGARLSWSRLSEGCACVAGLLSVAEPVGAPTTYACPNCDAGRLRVERQGHTMIPRSA